MYEDGDDSTLRANARALIKTGKLPNRRPEQAWGGPGEGADCTICRAPVRGDELEFELVFARSSSDSHSDKYHVHVRCFRAWELELEASTVSRPSLPAQVEDGNMAGHECIPTPKQGPA
jgi:hypothetical protein